MFPPVTSVTYLNISVLLLARLSDCCLPARAEVVIPVRVTENLKCLLDHDQLCFVTVIGTFATLLW